MKYGFMKAAAVSPKVYTAEPEKNRDEIIRTAAEAAAAGAKLIVYPELALTGYTCGDLFRQDLLLDAAMACLCEIEDATEDLDALLVIGTPWKYGHRLYDAAAVLNRGELLGVVPKSVLSDLEGLEEHRYFAEAPVETGMIAFIRSDGAMEEAPFGRDLLFACPGQPELLAAVEIGSEAFGPLAPALDHTIAGATVMLNCGCGRELVGSNEARVEQIECQSARLKCAYVFAGCGFGESTTDYVYGGQKVIAADGDILEKGCARKAEILTAVFDVQQLASERRRTCFPEADEGYSVVEFQLEETAILPEKVNAAPFIPKDPEKRRKRLAKILDLQARGLSSRLEKIGCKRVIIGISGGLDSTLALLVAGRSMDILGLPRENILAVTMPCFGTTDRTYQNACIMSKALGTELREINIKESVRMHFTDIGHDESVRNAAYENAQARERTQILMDLANDLGGIVVGTGDLSELALGWATYNGDHMSMYAVNADVTKTLVRQLVAYYAAECGDEVLKASLLDVLDTPVSPELLPPSEGQIAQKTEDLVGPYELHDFFLYYMLRYGFPPEKLFVLAKAAFDGTYSEKVILHWLKTFTRRFFSQQYKRSCLCDGPAVGTVGISPRGGLFMPSDVSASLWLGQIEEMEANL